MTDRGTARVFSIPPGVPFLPTLADALMSGKLTPEFDLGSDPLALSRATIYVPTRRAARALRALFAETGDGRPSILPSIKALGEFDEDEAAFDRESAAALDLAPPVPQLDRLLLLAPLARNWKRALPAYVASRFDEELVVPVSTADSIWLARDLARLMDDVETEQTDWAKLATLVPDDYAGWWQVTLKFLEIVTEHWPRMLAERGQSNPAAHRNALIAHETARLKRRPPEGPVIAAGSTGSIPATAELLAAIARLPLGAVVLPGLDRAMDERSWAEIAAASPEPAVVGHPQYGLAKLLRRIGVARSDVVDIGAATPALSIRARLVGESLRPSETTDSWPALRDAAAIAETAEAFADVTIIDAASERDEALTIALVLRRAVDAEGRTAALVTGDRGLARRVAAELLRFGVVADDSGGTALAHAPAAMLLRLLVRAALGPGDPVTLLSLLKHPLLRLGNPRPVMRRHAEIIELISLRGGAGRVDAASLMQLFETRLATLQNDSRRAVWFARLSRAEIDGARQSLAKLTNVLRPLSDLAGSDRVDLPDIALASVRALESLARDEAGSVAQLYAQDAGQRLVEFLRGLLSANAPLAFAPAEWPDVLDALITPETVKPRAGADRRIAIWGALEARLQSVDTLVLGGLNEGSWPRKADADRFMSRTMRTGIDLEPPERAIGLAAHDFQMAMGAKNVVLSRAARAGDAPAVASRWLQRLITFLGEQQAILLRARGDALLAWARRLDEPDKEKDFVRRPCPKPPVALRPKRFSVTEIETLRRDPYAIYARRILNLVPIEPLLRDPAAAERGSLFHDIMHRFTQAGVNSDDLFALDTLLKIGRDCIAEAKLPADVAAVWLPRFEKLAPRILVWEHGKDGRIASRHPEERATPMQVGATGVQLSGRADRIDLLAVGMAEVLDYKTGSSPSKGQAHTLLAPQLALEGALLKRGAFESLGLRGLADLAYVRLKSNGEVIEESILKHGQQTRTADDLSEEAWDRLDRLLTHYNDATSGYISRALPFREGDMDGDYDHLARVLEWSAGADEPEIPE